MIVVWVIGVSFLAIRVRGKREERAEEWKIEQGLVVQGGCNVTLLIVCSFGMAFRRSQSFPRFPKRVRRTFFLFSLFLGPFLCPWRELFPPPRMLELVLLFGLVGATAGAPTAAAAVIYFRGAVRFSVFRSSVYIFY